MGDAYGIQAPGKHVGSVHRRPVRYLVVIESAGASTALLFLETRELAGDVPASSEEIAAWVEGLVPSQTAGLPEWDAALASHSAEERAAADVYTLAQPPSLDQTLRP